MFCGVFVVFFTTYIHDKTSRRTFKPRPRIGNPRTLITTMLVDNTTEYAAAAVKLIVSIKRSAQKVRSDFVLLSDKNKKLDPKVERELRAVGWSLMKLAPNLGRLSLWNLTGYDQVIYFDSDCLVIGSLRDLLSVDLEAAPLWATRDVSAGIFMDSLDASVLVLRPDAKEFDRLVNLKKSQQRLSDLQVIEAAYKDRFGDIGFANNANLVTYDANSERWQRAKLNVIHYTVQKPWNCGAEYAEVCALWQELPVSVPCEVTLVTSYFDIPSKHSADEYRDWMSNLLSLDACMVIATAERSRGLFVKRNPWYTRYVNVELDDAAQRLNRSKSFWSTQFAQDPEAFRHQSYRLYWVWALKPVLMRDAVLHNDFHSRYFFWADIGCLRDKTYFGRSLQKVPAQVRNCNSVIFASVSPFLPIELQRKQDGTASLDSFSDHLAGAIWGGKAAAVLRFHDAYFRSFSRLANTGAFVGKDQSIMNIACIENDGLCMVLTPDPKVYSEWFYMMPFLLGDTPQDVPAAVVGIFAP